MIFAFSINTSASICHFMIVLGSIEGIGDIVARYHVASEGNVTFNLSRRSHGSLVCGHLECINHVGLVSNANIPCQHVITKSPNTSDCDITLKRADKWGFPQSESQYDVADDIIFSVEGMNYQPDLYNYKFDVTSNNTNVQGGQTMVDNLGHVTGLPSGEYVITVMATNTFGYKSNVITQNLTTYGFSQILTGMYFSSLC